MSKKSEGCFVTVVLWLAIRTQKPGRWGVKKAFQPDVMARATKRQRTQQTQGVEHAWEEGESTHSVSSLPAPELVDVDLPSEAIPHDTLVALQLLVHQFPPAAKVPQGPVLVNHSEACSRHSYSSFGAQACVAPFALRSQLYSLVNDRTCVDRQLDELR